MDTLVPPESKDGRPETESKDTLAQEAVELAARILRTSAAYERSSDRKHAQRMAGMLDDPAGKSFTIALSDEVLRIQRARRGARRFRDLLQKYGIPRYLDWKDRLLLRIGAAASRIAPRLVMPSVAWQVRSESSGVIIPGEDTALTEYLTKRRVQGMRININQLGEAVLGEGEAARRLDAVLSRLAHPEIDYVSVKVSAIFSQIRLVAYAEVLEQIKARLRILYRAALAHPTRGGHPKFVNLDMEEYRDLSLTVDAFRSVLDEPEFLNLEAGIVLQAYLPDSLRLLERLTAWARARVAHNGAGIKVRLVKGANLAMEAVEAAMHGWEPAPYGTKCEVDANFKRLLRFACQPENARAVRIGVGSHNLFDLAYGLLLRERNGVEDRVEFEMLEGMANAQAASLHQCAGDLLLYAPVVEKAQFQSAIAYLVRRLEENTAPHNFLHDIFGLKEGSIEWSAQKKRFVDACLLAKVGELTSTPRRNQNRLTERPEPDAPGTPFVNAPDTDFALQKNREWIGRIRRNWENAHIATVPIQAGGQERRSPILGVGRDPSRPRQTAYRYAIGSLRDVDSTLVMAADSQRSWEELSFQKRSAILRNAAAVMATYRDDTIGSMMLDGGKSVTEADAEVSEAIDFANYYARSLDDPAWYDGTRPKALGVVLVTSPWNFPYAIPAGGCLAALMAGNAVILKPSLESVLTARKVAEHLWEAGVPRDLLQFLTVPDDEIGRRLVTDDRVDAVVLTGAYDTARMFLGWKPAMRLAAETSGKNCLIITEAADLDLAIKDLVTGAFGHAGQKCSATSLGLIEAPVYDDPTFRRQLKDATESLKVGSAWGPENVVTPLIREPGKELQRALTTLDSGEEWLVEPAMIGGNPCLWSPGVRLGVRRGGWFHRTECFGPVLGLMRVSNLEEAIELQNDSVFGLTGGIHSLDESETARWQAEVEVGNAYINRATTGAIVQRQPFGGWKQSSVGPGAKAGGPNYISMLALWVETGFPRNTAQLSPAIESKVERLAGVLPPGSREKLRTAAASYAFWWREHFSREHDPSNLFCERNVFRYRPVSTVIARLEESDPQATLAACRIAIACEICDAPVEFSTAKPIAGCPSIVETATQFASRLLASRLGQIPRTVLRTLMPPGDALFKAAHAAGVSVHSGPPLANGRLELLHYLREQTVSETTHRHGMVNTW